MSSKTIWQQVIQTAKDVRHEMVERDELITCVSEGNLPSQGGRLSVQYLGRKRFAEDFLMFFDRDTVDAAVSQKTGEPMGIVSFLRQRSEAQVCPDDADILLVDAKWEQTPQDAVYLAPHINAVLPVMPTIEEQIAQVRSKGHRRKLQSALKHGFSWRATRSMADFNLFYDVMYAPFVHERFRYGAFQVPKPEMAEMYRRRGLLLFVEENDTPISGAFLYFSRRAPGRVFYWKYGLAHSKELSPNVFGERNAMTEAMVLQYAVSEKYSEIDFGLTHALPLDGIFMHKKRVGNDFIQTPNAPQFRMLINPKSQTRVLSRFPMVLIIGGQLHAWIAFQGESTPKRLEELQENLRACCFRSLKSIRLFTDIDPMHLPQLANAAAVVQKETGVPIALEALAPPAT
jgi:hypothetical protein